MRDDDQVNDDIGELPEAKTDNQDRAPGGADATVLESDVGASLTTDPDAESGTDLVEDTVGGQDRGELLVADQPLSAQQDEEQVPDAIQESDQEKQDPDEDVAKNESEPAD